MEGVLWAACHASSSFRDVVWGGRTPCPVVWSTGPEGVDVVDQPPTPYTGEFKRTWTRF